MVLKIYAGFSQPEEFEFRIFFLSENRNYFDSRDEYLSTVDLFYDENRNSSIMKRYDADGKLEFYAYFRWENRASEILVRLF